MDTSLLLYFCAMQRLYFIIFLAIFSFELAFSQHVWIEKIEVSGNQKTRTGAVLRELDFRVGDSISLADLHSVFERNRRWLMNTELFNEVKFNIRGWSADQKIVVQVVVVESWYIWPVPVFRLADRNFNVWRHEFDYSLRRIFYGLDLHHVNFTGNKDRLKIGIQFGYARRQELMYNIPGINRSRTLGFRAEIFHSRLREVPLTTRENLLVFLFRPDQDLGRQLRISVALNWRPQLFARHEFLLERRAHFIADTVGKVLQPDYFLGKKTRQQHWSAVYAFEYDRRDIRPYPLNGWSVRFEIRQNGLLPFDDLHLTRLSVRTSRYFSLGKKWSLEMLSAGRLSFPRKKIPYFNNQSLGYGNDFVRGYEYFVVDGLDFGLLKTSLHFEILNKTVNFGKIMPLKGFRTLPLKVYLSANNDWGYANDPFYADLNPLANQLLHGYGIGLDVVAYYTRVGSIEISRNRLGQVGIFYRIKAVW